MDIFSLNLLVLLCGLGLAGLGVWLVAEEHFYLGTGGIIIIIKIRDRCKIAIIIIVNLWQRNTFTLEQVGYVIIIIKIKIRDSRCKIAIISIVNQQVF